MAYGIYKLRLKAVVTVSLPIAIPPFSGGIPLPFAFEVSSFAANWELNGIPNCTLTAPLGREMNNLNNVASVSIVHWVVNFLQLVTPLQVFAKVEAFDAVGNQPDPWPDDWFMVFDGNVTATGYRKEFSAAEFSLHGIHWLADLDFSSPFSQISHPLNPAQYNFPAHMPLFGIVQAGGLPATAQSAAGIAFAFFDGNIVSTDFWGSGAPVVLPSFQGLRGGLKYWLLGLSAQKRFNHQQIRAVAPSFVPELGTNYEMQRAINRFEPINDVYTWGVPLSMEIGPLATQAARGIRRAIGMETVESLSGVTMWDKLVSAYAQNFMFAVVPMVDRALVVPFNPFLRAPWGKIRAKDYNYIELGKPLLRPIRGVGVMNGRASIAGGDISGGPASRFSGIEGYYEGRRDGMIIITTPPRWMADFDPSTFVLNSSGAAAQISNGIQPSAGVAAPGASLQEARLGVTQLCNAYARTRYLESVLQGRSGMLSGRLRFDIGPGAIVEIEGSSEKFVGQLIGNANAAEQKIFGMVQRVSIMMDAQSKRAGTSFQLGFLRNAHENTLEAFSTNVHPFWSTPWRGAPIVNSPVFAAV